jgi:hypothetical protein
LPIRRIRRSKLVDSRSGVIRHFSRPFRLFPSSGYRAQMLRERATLASTRWRRCPLMGLL